MEGGIYHDFRYEEGRLQPLARADPPTSEIYSTAFLPSDKSVTVKWCLPWSWRRGRRVERQRARRLGCLSGQYIVQVIPPDRGTMAKGIAGAWERWRRVSCTQYFPPTEISSGISASTIPSAVGPWSSGLVVVHMQELRYGPRCVPPGMTPKLSARCFSTHRPHRRDLGKHHIVATGSSLDRNSVS